VRAFLGVVDFRAHFAVRTAASRFVGLEKTHLMKRGMRDRHRLLGLKNSELLASLSDLVRRSNELTGDLLAHLAELEGACSHLELGFSSAFAYCIQALGWRGRRRAPVTVLGVSPFSRGVRAGSFW